MAVPARGLFRVRLNPGRLEPLALHPGWLIDSAEIAGGGRYLLYQLSQSGQAVTWIYDFARGLDRALPTLSGRGGFLVSDDGVWAAAQTGRRFGDPALAFVDLDTGRILLAPGPFGPHSGDVLYDLAWVKGAHRLTFRTGRDSQIWSVDADRGARPARAPASPMGTRDRGSVHGGVVDNIALPGGGAVESNGVELRILRPGMPPRVIAHAPPSPAMTQGQVPSACGQIDISLLHLFNNDIVLFTLGWFPRVYSVGADRTAGFPFQPGWLLIW